MSSGHWLWMTLVSLGHFPIKIPQSYVKNVCSDNRWRPDVLRNEKRLWQEKPARGNSGAAYESYTATDCEICVIYLPCVGTSASWELKMLEEFVLCSDGEGFFASRQTFNQIKVWSDDNIFNHACFWTASIMNTSGVLWKLLHITSLKCRSQLKETSFNKSLNCFVVVSPPGPGCV